jgi:hypothetical protein
MRRRATCIQSPSATTWRPTSKTADSVPLMSAPPPPATIAECLVYWQRPLGADASVRRLTVQVRQQSSRNSRTTVGRTARAILTNCWALPLTLSQLPCEIRKDCAAHQAQVQTLQIVGSNSLIESDGTIELWEWICQCLQQELFVSNSVRNIHFVSDCSDQDCAILLRACAASIKDLRSGVSEAATTTTTTMTISTRSLSVSIDGMTSSRFGTGEGAFAPFGHGNYTQTLRALRHLILRELRLEYGAVWTRNDVDCLQHITCEAGCSLQRVALHRTLLEVWSAYAPLIQWAESAPHVAITIVNCAVAPSATTCTLENVDLEMQCEARLWTAQLEFLNWNATLQTWRRALLLRRCKSRHNRTGHNEYRTVVDSVVTILRDWYRSSLDVVHPIGTATIDQRFATPCMAAESGHDRTSVKATITEPIAPSRDGTSSTVRVVRSEYHSLNTASVLQAPDPTCAVATLVGPSPRS